MGHHTRSTSKPSPSLHVSPSYLSSPDQLQMKETAMATSPTKRKPSKRHRKKRPTKQKLTLAGLLVQAAIAIPTVAGGLISFVMVLAMLGLGCVHGGKHRTDAMDNARAKLSQLVGGGVCAIVGRVLMCVWFVLVAISLLSVVGIQVHTPLSSVGALANGQAIDASLLSRGSALIFRHRGVAQPDLIASIGSGDDDTDGDDEPENDDDVVPEQEGM
jgi:hypothetical protein